MIKKDSKMNLPIISLIETPSISEGNKINPPRRTIGVTKPQINPIKHPVDILLRDLSNDFVI
jgi:hypothetical protein